MERPPLPDYTGRGIVVALVVYGLWLSLTVTLVQQTSIVLLLVALPLQTFLFTGLFICAHDAMHGLVAPKHESLNLVIGWLCTLSYAAFSFSKLKKNHLLHHGHPGDPEHDPDFHNGEASGFFRWYLRFVGHYIGWIQIGTLAVIFNVLEHVVGLSAVSLLLGWVVPSLLSTLQLFFFGTYLPHRQPASTGDPHHARSNPYPTWLSFLTCYHFGYHREHHAFPWVPWWRLPAARALDAT